MAGFLNSPWINVTAAGCGGLLLGFGIGRFAHEPSIIAAVATVFGLIMLWWAVSDRRKFRRGTPESERDGSHTIE